MKNAIKIGSMLLSIMLMLTIVGCPKKVVKTQPIAPPDKPIITEEEEEVETPMLTLNTIYFDFDKSDIRTGDAEILKANAKSLKDNAKVNITIEGHCDPMGTSEYNMALGWRRATAAQDYLMKLGIDKARLNTISYGEERLMTNNEADYWQNRRCEFVQK
jgi:peptidoglycan-associated lipoprotein